MVRIAIIGAGYVGKIHAGLLHAHVENGCVVAVADSVAEKAEAPAAAERGMYIFCEKPLAGSNDEAERMIKAVNRCNVKAIAGHVLVGQRLKVGCGGEGAMRRRLRVSGKMLMGQGL